MHALVTQVSPGAAEIRFGQHTATLSPADVAWTKPKLKLPDILHAGDIVYVKVLSLDAGGKARVSLEQDSGAEGALVAIDNATGEIKAMVGGRDFNLSKFNRATQALRQVGSSFKPYVYTAVIDQGGSPDDTILDAPVTFQTASGPYSPHNYDDKFEGTITLRRALAQSRNIPALKLADHIGIKTVIDYAHRFGITVQHSRVSSGGAGFGRNHAARADLGLQRVSERRRARRSALHHQGDRLRRPHSGRGLSPTSKTSSVRAPRAS